MHAASRYSATSITDSLIELATERRSAGAIFSEVEPSAILIATELDPLLMAHVCSVFAPAVLGSRAVKVAITADISIADLFERAAASPSGIAWSEFHWDRSVNSSFYYSSKGCRPNPFYCPPPNVQAGTLVVHGHQHCHKLRLICSHFKVPVPDEIWGEPIADLRRAQSGKHLALCA